MSKSLKPGTPAPASPLYNVVNAILQQRRWLEPNPQRKSPIGHGVSAKMDDMQKQPDVNPVVTELRSFVATVSGLQNLIRRLEDSMR